MVPETLTGQRAFDLLREVVAQFGEEYADPRSQAGRTCVYWDFDQPSCIVGQVLHRHGWSGGELAVSQGNVYALARNFPGRTSQGALEILMAAQGVQDNEGTWGHALHIATITARRLGVVVD